MAEQNELDGRLAWIRDATRSLAPPASLLAGIEEQLEARRREPPVWTFLLRRARPLLLASAALAALALAAGWHAERRYEAAVAEAAIAMEDP